MASPQALLAACRTLLARHIPVDALEAAHVARTLALLRKTPAPLHRSNLPGHLTASAFVRNPADGCILLIHHAKLGRWLQPGGHVEPDRDESLLAAALRELEEETPLREADLRVALPAALDVDIHPIPAWKQEPAHEHHDVRFLFELQRAVGRLPDGLRWAPVGELAADADPSLARVARKLTQATLRP